MRRQKPFIVSILVLTFLLVAAFAFAPPAGAAPLDRYVSPSGMDAGDCSNNLSPCATISYAVSQAQAGDAIHLAAGAYTGFGNETVAITKSLTLDGAGPGATVVAPTNASATIFEISASNVTVSNMTLKDVASGLWAVRLWLNGGTIDNVTFDNVHFENNASRAIELHNNTLVTDLAVHNCFFDGNGTGIRLAAGSHGGVGSAGATLDGATISDTVFQNQSLIAFRQESSYNSKIRDLTISGSAFTSNAAGAVVVSEIRESTITDSTFEGNGVGIKYLDVSAVPGVPSGDVTIDGNTFVDQSGPAILAGLKNNPLSGPLTITANTITQTVDLLTTPTAMIDIGLEAAQTHAAVEVSGNNVTLEGIFGGADLSAHGILLRGGTDSVMIHHNLLDGGGVGSTGGALPTSGVVIHTTDADYGSIKPAVDIDVNHNEITGFVNGVSLFDSVADAFGGLPNVASILINRNALAGNSSFGARSGDSNAADATCNWWGDASGPSGNGPGSGDAISNQLAFVPWLITDDLDGPCVTVTTYEVFITPARAGKTAGLKQERSDILAYDYDAKVWAFFFDGSDVGLKRSVHSLAFDPFGCLLLSFGSNQKVIGLGKVFPQDIVKFCPTSLGDNTAGTFSMYFDGSDVGLSSKDERIDAMDVLPDGRILISTNGKFSLPGPGGAVVEGADHDLVVFTPTSLGDNTAGTWAMYLLGSTVPGLDKEDIIGAAVDPVTNDLFLSTYDSFNIAGVAGDNNDIVRLHKTGGSYTGSLFFNGQTLDYTRRIQAMQIDLP